MSAERDMEAGLDQERHERLCAYVFGELQGEERAAFERELAASGELRAERARLEATVALVQTVRTEERLSPTAKSDLVASARRARFRVLGRRPLELLVAALVLVVGAGAALRFLGRGGRLDPVDVRDSGAVARGPELQPVLKERTLDLAQQRPGVAAEAKSAFDAFESGDGRRAGAAGELLSESEVAPSGDALNETLGVEKGGLLDALSLEARDAQGEALKNLGELVQMVEPTGRAKSSEGEALYYGLSVAAPDAPGSGPGSPGPEGPAPVRSAQRPLATGGSAPAASAAPATPAATSAGAEGWFLGVGETQPQVEVQKTALSLQDGSTLATRGLDDLSRSESAEVEGYLVDQARAMPKSEDSSPAASSNEPLSSSTDPDPEFRYVQHVLELAGERGMPVWNPTPPSSEELARRAHDYLALLRPADGEAPRDMFFRWFGDAPFVSTSEERLSTFAADVDTASYALTRAYLKRAELPPREAIRTEEFVNYFRADQPAPSDGQPFALGLELAPNPFAADARSEILRVTVRARDVADFERKPVALTLVVDNSGSMEEGGRLELVKGALSLLLRELRPGDSVALVKFSQTAAVVTTALPATRRGELEGLIGSLAIEGGTNVEAGLVLGYEQALAALVPGAVNRVVLCSDGVGNIGETTAKALLARVEEARAKGLYLNTVGVGMGNHDDAFLEELADKGDGICNYVDSEAEAKRVFVDGLASAFQPVARDVKLQVEFEPAQVERWRLLGYENRALRSEDFRNDAIDAGEVNAGHQVTALYELVRNPGTGPVATARVRYKPPFALDEGHTGTRAAAADEVARELERVLRDTDVLPGFAAGSPGFRRAVLAAQFAEVLRASEHARGDSFARLVQETKALTSELDDADLRELLELLGLANPLLDARSKVETPRVQELSDRLARLQYEQALDLRRRELAAEAGEERRAQPEADAARQSRAAEIERLEAELRRELVTLFAGGR